jgi:hypothetical protein
MTDTQHTPGPWFATPGNYAVYVKDAYGDQGDLVCALSGYGSNYRLRAANARLIAAAPDLLEACQRALAEAVADDQDEWFANMRAAIAKATGQTD